MKRLQREEVKEATEFYNRIKADRDVQDRKFELETQVWREEECEVVEGGCECECVCARIKAKREKKRRWCKRKIQVKAVYRLGGRGV